jgi:hypothetical protein
MDYRSPRLIQKQKAPILRGVFGSTLNLKTVKIWLTWIAFSRKCRCLFPNFLEQAVGLDQTKQVAPGALTVRRLRMAVRIN